MSSEDVRRGQPIPMTLSGLVDEAHVRAGQTVEHDVEAGAGRLAGWMRRQRLAAGTGDQPAASRAHPVRAGQRDATFERVGREELDRGGLLLRADPVGAPVARPTGVDDRLGEVLDAVAAVVRKYTGLSVMVAIADGRAGQPVVRVTERDGSVETTVATVGVAAPTLADQTDAVPDTARPRPPVSPDVDHDRTYGEGAPVHATGPEPAYEPDGPDGRHAAPGDRSRHGSPWSAGARVPIRDAAARTDQSPPVPSDGTIPLPEDTGAVVSQLAQLLRNNPALASNWSRESPE